MVSDLRQARHEGRIELRQVTKRYGRERVVDSVSAVIEPGEFFSLLGPSGSGKTTTLMMIAGFADVDEGGVWVDGSDISSIPPQKRGFGMVFQNYAIFPHLNVFENVAFPLRARKMRDEEIRSRVKAALELVRLERFADRFSKQLSGGQQQRVAIARAIVFQPKVVLMDEPLGALDKNLRYQMQVEIKQIQERLGMTVVYVTHDQEEAMNMSDRIAIMNNGRIEQVAGPTEVYEKPVNEFVARFLGEANLVAGLVETVAGDRATLRLSGGQVLAGRVPSANALTVGQKAHLFIRPERVRIDASESSSPQPAAGDHRDVENRIVGRLVRSSFLGNILRHDVEIDAQAVVTVDETNLGSTAVRQPGMPVHLAWDAKDALLLKD